MSSRETAISSLMTHIWVSTSILFPSLNLSSSRFHRIITRSPGLQCIQCIWQRWEMHLNISLSVFQLDFILIIARYVLRREITPIWGRTNVPHSILYNLISRIGYLTSMKHRISIHPYSFIVIWTPSILRNAQKRQYSKLDIPKFILVYLRMFLSLHV